MAICCDQEARREAVRAREGWNGLDYVELGANETTLRAYFLGKLPPELVTPAPGLARYLALEGGVRVRGIAVLDVQPVVAEDPEQDDHLVIRLDQGGDFSAYTLRLVGLQRIDPRYAAAEFHFRIDCPNDLDCKPACDCPTAAQDEPDISYFAKDFSSFRQLVLDRLSLLMPDWRERHLPDLGISLVELLAWQADMLSYYQDSVATEATLDTARLRISVRRHARLVDYVLHEGCNARSFVCVEVDQKLPLPAGKLGFLSGMAGRALPTVLGEEALAEVPASEYEVFEPVAARDATLCFLPAHNLIHFHTFGDRLCCLPAGSTRAALHDTGLELAPGDLLLLEELRDPVTGLEADANPARRHPVRLLTVTRLQDEVVRTAHGQPTAYLEVTWAKADALPFPLCISAIGAAPDCLLLTNISVARGNVVLVDHGRSTGPEDLGVVQEVTTQAACDCEGMPGPVRHLAGHFARQLARAPLTWAGPADTGGPASSLLTPPPWAARPALSLVSEPGQAWLPRPDLLGSMPLDADVVVETDDDGVAHLRFGKGSLGMAPPAGARFSASYRVGNGPAGNVGAGSITRLLLRGMTLSGVSLRLRNPLPAQGGVVAETIAHAKLMAPRTFRIRLMRAVKAGDYATLAEADPGVQRASAELVWTGSWYEGDVAIDPLGSEAMPDGLLADVAHQLERYRRIGHDLHVKPAVLVALDLRLEVCVLPGHRRAEVRAALQAAFSTGRLADGSLGFFHPDALSFGTGIALSRIVARAQVVSGVAHVAVTRLQRLYEGTNGEIEAGLLALRSGEIARLDNDPNRPEHGRLELVMLGGR